MGRRIYISCDFAERDIEPVKALCLFLQETETIIEFAPQLGWNFYRCLEEAIDRSDSFIAIVGVSYSCSAWLNHELHYAYTLSQARMNPRPRLFGLRIVDSDLPNSSKHIPIEWLHDDNRNLLLEDLPKRG